MARMTFRLTPFALPAVVGVAWLAYPALTPKFKESIGLP
jgi:hypothetical protein